MGHYDRSHGVFNLLGEREDEGRDMVKAEETGHFGVFTMFQASW